MCALQCALWRRKGCESKGERNEAPSFISTRQIRFKKKENILFTKKIIKMDRENNVEKHVSIKVLCGEEIEENKRTTHGDLNIPN